MGESEELTANDTNALADRPACAYAGMLRYYREEMGLTARAAEAKASRLVASQKGRVLSAPPDRVSWFDLALLAE